MNDTRLVDPAPDALIAAAETLPFMSEKRFLEVRDSAMLLSGKAKEYDEDSAVKRLDAYLSELPDTAVIVFTVRGKADGRKKLYQALKKKAKLVSFDPLDDKELAQWIARSLKKAGKKINQAACQRLWFSAGRDLTLLNNELGKLAAYAGDRDEVTEKDVQMTQECWNELYRMLGDAPGRRSLYEIQQLVRDWIEQNLRYDERAYTVSGDGDFLRAMLTGGGAGYSVHYATAAALLLRYYGVPARYVEGYYLTPEQASEAQAGQSVVLTEKNAHAWAEYYLNGVGFVPFEVTPGYVDPEDLDLGSSQDGTGGDRFEYESAMSYAQTEEPDVEKPERGERDGLGARALWALLLIPLAALALLARRRLMLRRALRRIERSDDRDAVAMRYGYAMALKARCGDPELPGDVEAARLNLLALFSTREITAGDRAEMDAYAAGVLAECRKRWSFGRKLRLRLIDAVY